MFMYILKILPIHLIFIVSLHILDLPLKLYYTYYLQYYLKKKTYDKSLVNHPLSVPALLPSGI